MRLNLVLTHNLLTCFHSHGSVALSFSSDTDAGGDPLAVEKKNNLFLVLQCKEAASVSGTSSGNVEYFKLPHFLIFFLKNKTTKSGSR